MKAALFPAAILAGALLASCEGWAIGTGIGGEDAGRVIDHRHAALEALPEPEVKAAKAALSIAYWHTSHGSQLVTGMDGFFGGKGLYTYGSSPASGELPLVERSPDVGAFGSFAAFQDDVRSYLAGNPGTNVVMASWCGQVSGSSEEAIDAYLAAMDGLESEYTGVAFVYMTGHADGSGLAGNLHLRDQQIRAYCEENEKWLFDFYDIECYDPDGAYFGDKLVTDACNYDYDGDGVAEGGESGPSGGDRNWALDWQDEHPGEWWDCSSAHSQKLNANRKAVAAWRLFARIAEELD
ncbi:MAG TPA: hypothetical protein P5133_01305 [Spirochaetia bacterium]|nr:hypothetical protein [Spirochaetia bacterium]HRZ63534.1 hypothetical protein [Spirochaetia bacterium]